MKPFSLLVLSLYFFSVVGQLPSQDILALLEFKKGFKHISMQVKFFKSGDQLKTFGNFSSEAIMRQVKRYKTSRLSQRHWQHSREGVAAQVQGLDGGHF